MTFDSLKSIPIPFFCKIKMRLFSDPNAIKLLFAHLCYCEGRSGHFQLAIYVHVKRVKILNLNHDISLWPWSALRKTKSSLSACHFRESGKFLHANNYIYVPPSSTYYKSLYSVRVFGRSRTMRRVKLYLSRSSTRRFFFSNTYFHSKM